MFQPILKETVEKVSGALGALFLDWEGESVEIASRDSSTFDLKIIGAYQGIFLNQVKKICHDLEQGSPERFKLELSQITLLNWVLKDGYYVVLLLRPGSNEGVAWQELSLLRQRLLLEM
ncbi:MAG TPA: hypothetical protein VNM92_13720 [Thermoanaerobaculia bacterium]|nr:hypothetical protein [Thermoanaerobaculia bacterium]